MLISLTPRRVFYFLYDYVLYSDYFEWILINNIPYKEYSFLFLVLSIQLYYVYPVQRQRKVFLPNDFVLTQNIFGSKRSTFNPFLIKSAASNHGHLKLGNVNICFRLSDRKRSYDPHSIDMHT